MKREKKIAQYPPEFPAYMEIGCDQTAPPDILWNELKYEEKSLFWESYVRDIMKEFSDPDVSRKYKEFRAKEREQMSEACECSICKEIN